MIPCVSQLEKIPQNEFFVKNAKLLWVAKHRREHILLQTLTMTNHKEPRTGQKYVKLLDLAIELNLSKDKLYNYVYRHQDQIETYTLPNTGKVLHVSSADADMLRAIFNNPEDFAQKVRRPKK